MPRVCKYLCKGCKQRYTNDESHLCSRCRIKKQWKTCSICGKKQTTHPSGICAECRRLKAAPDQVTMTEFLNDAVFTLSVELYILKMRQRGVAYQKIADKFGMSKATVHKICSSLLADIHSRTIFEVLKDTTLKESLKNDPELNFSESKLEMYMKSSAKRSSFALTLDGKGESAEGEDPAAEEVVPEKGVKKRKAPAN